MDVALHKCGVTFVLDRAGVTGTDGASHNGMWDMSILQVVPGPADSPPRATPTRSAPSCARPSRSTTHRPSSASRRAPSAPPSPAVGTRRRHGRAARARHRHAGRAPRLRGRARARCAWRSPRCWTQQGISTTVVDPRWVKPVDEAMAPLAERHRVVVTVEDNSRVGGVGSAVAQALRDAGVDVPLRDFGIPPRFLDHASRGRGHGRDRPDRTGHRPPGHRPCRPGSTAGSSSPRSTRWSPPATDRRPTTQQPRWAGFPTLYGGETGPFA